ncbi:hypothetical protein FB45DRAFT_888971 [Roridomyces roridus]|uniref:Uncharacterized protein n=1 Tax=Roridomyces roridus TaxID=1738132 RepID=A0AAD7CK38_9AGAR|nr:hypothetical protein FB45DRAFT_888971 [Roridomyces roridus]
MMRMRPSCPCPPVMVLGASPVTHLLCAPLPRTAACVPHTVSRRATASISGSAAIVVVPPTRASGLPPPLILRFFRSRVRRSSTTPVTRTPSGAPSMRRTSWLSSLSSAALFPPPSPGARTLPTSPT